MEPFNYFSFQPVIHNWCNKDRGVGYHVYVMVQIKYQLLIIDKKYLAVSFLSHGERDVAPW